MTPKIARFLFDQCPDTPCLVLDVDRAEENFRALRHALPAARIYYAVKANPARPILERLAAAGACFDAASLQEVEACLAAGASPSAIGFGNTVKKECAIARAYALGVRLFAFDSEAELNKLARSAPGSEVYCRLLVENKGAEWPLSRKFGASATLALQLMRKADLLGLQACGLSFHVGSQQVTVSAYQGAIEMAAPLWKALRDDGLPMRLLNIGGGFPVPYRAPVPCIGEFADSIHATVTRCFGNARPDILVEPGRFIVGDAGIVRSEVVLVSRKDEADPVRWVYFDIGRFGGLAETEGECIKYRIETPHDGGEVGPVAVAGPTCDGADILYERADYRLPVALRDGDTVTIHDAGAYVTTYASQGFNGFPPLAEHYV